MPFEVTAAGMVTPVGFDAPSSCAAMRVAIDAFRETRFMFDGDWLRGAMVNYDTGVQGRGKLVAMARDALDEALAKAPPPAMAPDTLLLACLPELGRPGRLPGLDETFFVEVRSGLAHHQRLLPQMRRYDAGSKGAFDALAEAQKLLDARRVAHCVILGVDSFHSAETLEFFHGQRRLVTAANGDGFLPGEAAAAVVCSSTTSTNGALQCLGLGQGREPATLDSDLALKADGLVQAYRAAFQAARSSFEHIDYRLSDLTGELYAFKDAALALARTMRVRKDAMDLWHPTDCVGRVGAASVPLVLGVALAAAMKRYAPGPGVLCHFSEDDGWRGAAVLKEYGKPSRPVLV